MGKGIKLFTCDEYKFTTDTIILANFASPLPKDNVLEIGTGCGAIPIILARDNKAKHITALEIQSEACELLKKSIKINNLEDKITVINKDVRDEDAIPLNKKYDMVICNPPYKKSGCGEVSELYCRATARNETQCTLEDIIKKASKVLNQGGDLCMCNRVERLCDMIGIMRLYKIEPKVLQLVQYNIHKEPKLFLTRGKKFGKVGLRCNPTLTINNEKGEYTEEMKSIYKYYYKG